MSPFVSANPEWDAPGVVIDAQAALDRAIGGSHGVVEDHDLRRPGLALDQRLDLGGRLQLARAARCQAALTFCLSSTP